MVGASYTWMNNQVQSIRRRIDRVLVSPDWECQFPNVIQQALARPCSDHSPLALICDCVKGGPSPFHCETFWYAHPDFFTFIQNAWSSFNVTCNAGFVFCKKIQLLKPLLKDWAKQEFGDMERRLEELKETFVQLDAEEDVHNGLNEDQWNARLKARKDYCSLSIAKSEKLRSRSKVTHMLQHEENTKYFHRPASDRRRRRNSIGAIKVGGVMTYDVEEVKQELDAEESECLSAIKCLGQNKAPGPDGFAISFYLLCWEVIKVNIMKIFQELQHRNFLDCRLKNTFISLISKKDTIEEIKYLRPICLVHGMYKIISKVLAERIKQALLSDISSKKTAFIKRRQILDGVLVANELIDSGIRSGRPGLLSGYFKSKKGIRQGDPLSPFLFILVGETLSYMIKQAQDQGLISSFQAVEEGWKKPLLNKAGKLTLINIVLASLPTYYMSLFEMSASVAKIIKIDERLLILYRRRKFGGLWIKNIRKMNHALLTKWLWRYAKKNDVLWKNLIAEKYDNDGVDWLSKYPTGTFGRAVWKGVMKCKHIFINNINFKVNRGTNTKLNGVTLNQEEEDCLEWTLTSKKNFSVKSTYDKLANTEMELPVQGIFKLIWRLKVV
ncbi:uncharacterized protein LOC113324683 [Papaver somniferum]|uniref:uncharacterized protein LOC113324683 n=1 Tax=Papaver somniferum TaxID=3469 RepID=UPI000E6F4EB0|nr:uncharacterized protein LOC113324683 [Papaver somniferum]